VSARSFQPEVSVELEVPFHDVDMLQVAWHGHYYKYMELARTALLRRYELGAEQLLGAGYSLLVIESKCRHTHPLRIGDRVRVGAAFLDVEHRLHIAYDIHNLSREQRAAYGHTMLATVDSSGRLQLKTPDAIVERILRR